MANKSKPKKTPVKASGSQKKATSSKSARKPSMPVKGKIKASVKRSSTSGHRIPLGSRKKPVTKKKVVKRAVKKKSSSKPTKQKEVKVKEVKREYPRKIGRVKAQVRDVATAICGELMENRIRCKYDEIIDIIYYLLNYMMLNKRLPVDITAKEQIVATYMDFDQEYYYGSEVITRIIDTRKKISAKNIYFKGLNDPAIVYASFYQAFVDSEKEASMFWRARDLYMEDEDGSMQWGVWVMFEEMTGSLFVNFDDYITQSADADLFNQKLQIAYYEFKG